MKGKIVILTVIILITFLTVNQAIEQNMVLGQVPTQISMEAQSNTTSVLPNSNYSELTLEAQKSFWAFLNQVAGINTNTYNVTKFNISPINAPGSQKTQIAISAIITKDSENISISMEVTEGKITFYKLDLISGSLHGAELEVNAILAKTKNAIIEYKANFNAAYCTELDQLVPSSITSNNFTIERKNTLLNVQLSTDPRNSLNCAQLVWYTKIVNSTVNSQSIQVEIAKTGILTKFIDNLGLYKLATNTIAITRDEAITSANKSIETFAAAKGLRLKSVDSELSYVPDINGTRGDCFSVYPLWHISAKFDEPQKGVDVYSIYSWADSGKVRNQGPESRHVNQQSALEIPTSNFSLASISAIAALGLTSIIIGLRSASRLKGKRNIFKISGIAFLLSLTFSLVAVQPSIAYPFASSIYSSRGHPPNIEPYGEDELQFMSQLTSDIGSWSNQVGYTAYNYYGEGTNSENLYLGAADHGEAASIVFYNGHGGSDPYGIMNDNSTITYASDIYDNSQQHGWSKFAYFDSCEQGDGSGSGSMAEAMLHTTSESSDGYHNPDLSMNCFVGWTGDGPWLKNTVYDVYAANYWFIHNFYSYAMIHGYSVNAALDKASLANWQVDFDDDNNPFHTGWTDSESGTCGHLVVFGQGTMYIGNEGYVLDSPIDMSAGYSELAQVGNPTNLIGPEDDGCYTQLLAPCWGDYATITAALQTQMEGGYISLWGYSESYSSHLTVYVSSNYFDWYTVYDGYVDYGNPRAICCDYYGDLIYFIAICAQNDAGGYPARMYIDAVHVAHP